MGSRVAKPSDNSSARESVPFRERAFDVIASVVLLAYGSYGLWIDGLWVLARSPVRVHGVAAVIVFCSFLVAASVLISHVVDHLDRRNNERSYKEFARIGTYAGWTLYIIGIYWGLFTK
jgi:hypothetical protein